MIYLMHGIKDGSWQIINQDNYIDLPYTWEKVLAADSCCDLLLKMYEQEKDNKRTRYYVRRDSWRRTADNFGSDEFPHFRGLNAISGFVRQVYETKISDDYSYGYYDDEFEFISELWIMSEDGESIHKVFGFDTFSERKPSFEEAPMRKRGNRSFEISKRRESDGNNGHN